MTQVIDLAADETVQSIMYGRSVSESYALFPCEIKFVTNLQSYGPFSTRDCGGEVYRVDPPPGEPLEGFFSMNAKTRQPEVEGVSAFFDGFMSATGKMILI